MGKAPKHASNVVQLPAGSGSGPETLQKLTPRGLATRQKLLDGARQAFCDLGYDRTRVADIAKNAGVSLGNFYRHFDEKDAILIHILRPLYDELRSVTGRGATTPGVFSKDALAERNLRYLRYYAEHRKLFRVSREAAASSQSNAFFKMWLDMRGAFIARTANWLAMLARTGDVNGDMDLRLLADSLGSMNEQLAYTRIALAEEAPSEAAMKEMANTLAMVWWRAIFEGRDA